MTKLIAADRQGLLPDPWLQTATLCATIIDVNRVDKGPATNPHELLKPASKKQSAEQLEAGFHQRRRMQR